VSPRVVGAEHRYAYSVGYRRGTEPKDRMDIPSFDRVFKHDLRGVERDDDENDHTTKCPHDSTTRGGRTPTTYELGDDRACGDILFVPATDADDAEEDDGHVLVLTHVMDALGNSTRTELIVLDAKDMTPAATVHVPTRVPFGFHNEFVPADALRGWDA